MITVKMNQQSLLRVEKQIDKYAKDLRNKCVRFVTKMLDCGYEVAVSNATGTFGKYITIAKNIDSNEQGIKAILYATDSGNIESVYKTKEGEKSISISPLLMLEFGSGFKAENPLGIEGVGQGSHPEQKHAFDVNGWWFMTTDNQWIHSYGYSPHAPMYKAQLEMENKMIEIAKEVF